MDFGPIKSWYERDKRADEIKGNVGAYYRKVVIDIRTGQRRLSRPFYHVGPIAELTPNQHPSIVKSNAQLNSGVNVLLTPDAAVERVPWTFYHAQTYTSGTTTQLIYFQTTGGIQVTNMQASGQIASPQFFDLYHLGLYYQLPVSDLSFAAAPSNDAVGGAANDILLITNGIATFTYAQKQYYQAPLWMLPPGFGVNGRIATGGTYSATHGDVFQIGQLGVPDIRNRPSWFGDITLAHNQNFALQLDWAAAVTLNHGNTTITGLMDGYLYRRAL